MTSRPPILTPAQVQSWRDDGFLIVDDILFPDQVERLLRIWRGCPQLAGRLKENRNFDGDDGPRTRLAYRSTVDDDAWGAVARCARLVQPMEDLYGASVDCYYTLNMQKDPGTGGWEYHQDYGYHYREFLYPDFVSVMVALDPATRANGCLRVVPGSHRLGRLEHEKLGSQQIASRERLGFARRELGEVACELAPGSVLYFDGNLLHASDPNGSTASRWSLVIAYVPSTNVWVLPDRPQMTPVKPLDDDAFGAALAAHEARLP